MVNVRMPFAMRTALVAQMGLAFWIGLSFILGDSSSWQITIHSFDAAQRIMPLDQWGWVFIVLGLGYFFAFWSLKWYGRWSIVGGFVYLLWASLLVMAWQSDGGSPVIVGAFSFIAVSHLSTLSYTMNPRVGE